ncbi:Interferon-induced GTP-binding protein Mx [Golovinomyces cichoracearum]|uniref:Interferon-induced GTP-binding protein Mx n=1 Tax=Golovinomyces cichoracearum TaxID=62708 RepID=A0A420IEZ7_9PEZI|nr:Interferon-induced GTP-binding protein Mx [Golovinomyces cichoracearum]
MNRDLVNGSLYDFETEEQRRVLDTISNIRRCGIDSFLSLPQIVVCGDQSSGKSSVLEALTEIPFPRSDNLCTRYATEIILRRAEKSSLIIKIIPDSHRPHNEQEMLKNFEESITDFNELPDIMDIARDAMGIKEDLTLDEGISAFSRDVLSITMEGPDVPQLTLVDIPGLIANATLGVSEADVQTVADITNSYISQSRTICLAVISATNDHANQSIVTRIKKYDPDGDRTLGVITKPDRLEAGSASEKGFIALAQNKDINYKLGWHVVKNRSFLESETSLAERNLSESNWLRNSNFNVLPPDNLGIKALRNRLSMLLFEHVKAELPKLRQELENRLVDYKEKLEVMGDSRATTTECRPYLVTLAQKVREICKDAIDGHYQDEFFTRPSDVIDCGNEIMVPVNRIRAVVQCVNSKFASDFHEYAHKYQFSLDSNEFLSNNEIQVPTNTGLVASPIAMKKDQTISWISSVVNNSRGSELMGNFNPLLVGELFWEQSCKWKTLAEGHIDKVSERCRNFLRILIREKCPDDVESRLWNTFIVEALDRRSSQAREELEIIMKDLKRFPINYNKIYVEELQKKRRVHQEGMLRREKKNENGETYVEFIKEENVHEFLDMVLKPHDLIHADAQSFTCLELFDSLLAIYKIQREVFIANITTQVIERHIVRGIEGIFDPVAVSKMSDKQIDCIALEPQVSRNNREYLLDRIHRLEEGNRIFRGLSGR